MKLPSFKRLIVEDFDQKDQKLVSKIAYCVNTTFDDVLNALSNNLSVSDNFTMVQKSITVSVDGNGNPKGKTTVSSGLGSQCAGITVIRATNSTNSLKVPTGTPFITFVDNSGQISISNISNLQANQTYVLTIILWPA